MKIFFLISAFTLIFKTTYCWWDITHMTIASIGEKQMEEKDVDKLNSFLSLWQYNFPQMHNMVNSTTFPDHIRCTSVSPNCNGLPFTDAATMFNGFHSVTVPHTLPEQEMDVCHISRPMEFDSSSEGIHYFMTQAKTHIQKMKENPCTEESCPIQYGSDFSWNFILRYMLHLYGDLHMPCHVGSGVSPAYPNSDSGCAAIPMGYPKSEDYDIPETGKNNFHQYMDGIGYTQYGRWPFLSMDEISQNADKYILDYPKSEFVEELKVDPWDITAITYESYAIHNQIYEEIDFFNLKEGEELVLTPQQELKLQEIFKKRIALCGYRFGAAMTEYANALPDLDNKNLYTWVNMEEFQPTQCPTCETCPTCPPADTGSQENNNDTLIIVLAVLLAVFVILAGFTSMTSYKLMKKQQMTV